MSRYFSRTQRAEAHFRQRGRCAICRSRMLNFEGDHVHPWSEGGDTQDDNLALLCHECHQAKTALDQSLHDWQRECRFAVLQAFLQNEGCLVVADTGSGKTRAAVASLIRLTPYLTNPLFVIVVPSIQISGGWSRELDALNMSLEIGSTVKDGLAADNAALISTYAGLERMAKPIRGAAADGRDVIFVFDEIHHCRDDGEEEDADWASVADRVLGTPRFRIFLTGTPFRTKGRIPWLETTTDEDGEEVYKHAYKLERRRAISERWTRSARFTMVSHSGTLTRINQETREEWEAVMDGTGDKVDEDKILARALRRDEYLLPFLEWFLRSVEAKRRIWKREEGPELTAPLGMVICEDLAHQKQVAGLLLSLGHQSTIVHTNINGSHAMIDRFRKRQGEEGRSQILLSCNMVSEGCDIPPLTIGAILTTRRTDLVIDQMVGRFRRVTDFERKHFNSREYVADLIVPSHHRFVSYASRMLDLEVEIKLPGEGGGWQESTASWALAPGLTEFSSVLLEEDHTVLHPLARSVMSEFRMQKILVDEEDPRIAEILNRHLGSLEQEVRHTEKKQTRLSPNEERSSLRAQSHKIAQWIIGRTGREAKDVWVEAKQRAGLSPGRTVDVLEREELRTLVNVLRVMKEETP